MIDELQDIIDTQDLEHLDEYSKNARKFKNKIAQYKLPVGSYLEYLQQKYLKQRRITNREMLTFLIMLAYYDAEDENRDLSLFNVVMSIAYKNGLKQLTERGYGTKGVKPLSLMELYIMTLPNHLGWLWADYVMNEINYNATQLMKQITVEVTQKKRVDLESPVFKNIFEKQLRARLNISAQKASGAMEAHANFLVNQVLHDVALSAGVEKVKIIGINDSRQTKMCSSLNNQEFYLNDYNEYRRYSDSNGGVIEYKTFGLILGENLPPITDHFHYCRSTIEYL